MTDVNYSAPINQLGYGIAGQEILINLLRLGVNAALFPIHPIKDEDCPQQYMREIREAEKRSGLYNPSAPAIRVYHQNKMAEFPGRGRRVGFPFFELSTLTPEERHHLNNCDDLVVASKWAQCVCLENDIQHVPHVVPLGVNRGTFDDQLRTRLTRVDKDHTVFVNVGKWEIRKGHDVLLDAFNKAFSPSDRVILKMIPENPFIGHMNQMWARQFHGSKMGAVNKIQLYPRVRSQLDVARFLATADCGVFPARAEGWNLELIECMSLGLPCIATNYSAHTEFVDENNCLLIQVDKTEPANDGVWFHGQGEWACLGEGQEEQLIEHMRSVHRLKQTGQLPPNVGGIETANKFTWQNTATLLLGALTR